MRHLVADLDGNLEINQNIEITIANTIKFYFNFKRGTSYDKRIRQEVFNLFKEKKANKSLFFPETTNLRPQGFNQIINSLLKRLWDEENFNGLAKIPPITFAESSLKDVTETKIGLDEVQDYTIHLKLIPFIPPDKNIFKMPEAEQIKQSATWIMNGNNIQSLIEKYKIIGLYTQTVFFAGQNLIALAGDYSKEGVSEAKKNVETDEKIIEERSSILAQVILSHPLTVQGYFKFSESTLKRSIQLNASENLTTDVNLKYFYEILSKGKSGQKLSEQQVATAAAKVMADFKKLAFSPKVKTEEEPILPAENHKSFAMVIDMVLFELRTLLKSTMDQATTSASLKRIQDRILVHTEDFKERHLTFTLLYLKEPGKPDRMNEKDFLEALIEKGKKFKIAEEDVKYIYFLIQSEKADFGNIPLSYFVAQSIKEDNNTNLNEKQANQLRSVLGNLPKEVLVNHFYHIREKLKAKVQTPEKILMVESITEYIHIKIAEFRFSWAKNKIQEFSG